MSKRIRKSIWDLTEKEFDDLEEAFAEIMKLDKKIYTSYFSLAGLHGVPNCNCAHHRQLFLMWHRSYVKKFEDALRTIKPNITLPYWDVFSKEIQEGDITTAKAYPDRLKTSPTFQSFDTSKNLNSSEQEEMKSILIDYRLWDENHQFKTFRGSEANLIQKLRSPEFKKIYDKGISGIFWSDVANDLSVNSNRHGIEQPHDYIHSYIDGWMGNPYFAGFDPIFWFHHSNIERLLCNWQTETNTKTFEKLDEKKGDYTIPWKDSFEEIDWGSSQFSFASEDRVTGNMEKWVWDDEVEYGAPKSLIIPSRTMSLSFASINSDGGSKNEVSVSSSHSVMIKNIDRSKIKGPFDIRIKFDENESIIPVFQTGFDCSNCKKNKLMSFTTEVSSDWIKPGVKISFQIFHKNPINDEEIPITDFGSPSINIRALIQ